VLLIVFEAPMLYVRIALEAHILSFFVRLLRVAAVRRANRAIIHDAIGELSRGISGPRNKTLWGRADMFLVRAFSKDVLLLCFLVAGVALQGLKMAGADGYLKKLLIPTFYLCIFLVCVALFLEIGGGKKSTMGNDADVYGVLKELIRVGVLWGTVMVLISVILYSETVHAIAHESRAALFVGIDIEQILFVLAVWAAHWFSFVLPAWHAWHARTYGARLTAAEMHYGDSNNIDMPLADDEDTFSEWADDPENATNSTTCAPWLAWLWESRRRRRSHNKKVRAAVAVVLTRRALDEHQGAFEQRHDILLENPLVQQTLLFLRDDELYGPFRDYIVSQEREALLVVWRIIAEYLRATEPGRRATLVCLLADTFLKGSAPMPLMGMLDHDDVERDAMENTARIACGLSVQLAGGGNGLPLSNELFVDLARGVLRTLTRLYVSFSDGSPPYVKLAMRVFARHIVGRMGGGRRARSTPSVAHSEESVPHTEATEGDHVNLMLGGV